MARRTPKPRPNVAPAMQLRLVNALTALIIGALALALLAAGVLALVRSAWFPIRAIELEAAPQRTSVATVRANALPRLRGNFFSLDLAEARAAFETTPWVRSAVVRKVWPNRLAVRLEEHQPVALWDSDDGPTHLVNRQGETFEANLGDVDDQALPILQGPAGAASTLWTMYQRLRPVLDAAAIDIERLVLSAQGSWHVEAAGGAVIRIGRGSEGELVERVARFAASVGELTGHYGKPLRQADLRHRDGFALRLQGVTTSLPGASGRQAN